ncbi:MAG: hypothetical protein WD696_02870 [Bryobacteraceae bacterium]
MRRSGLSTALYVLMVFLSGVVLGGFAHRLYTMNPVRANSPDEYRRRYIDQLRSRLNLTDDQTSKVDAVLSETRTRYRQFNAEHKDELRSIQEQQVNKIRSLLNSEQQTEYQKFREERKKRSTKPSGC